MCGVKVSASGAGSVAWKRFFFVPQLRRRSVETADPCYRVCIHSFVTPLGEAMYICKKCVLRGRRWTGESVACGITATVVPVR